MYLLYFQKSMNMIQKDSDEETMSSYVIRLSDVDSKISQINKHLQWWVAKKKFSHVANHKKEKKKKKWSESTFCSLTEVMSWK